MNYNEKPSPQEYLYLCHVMEDGHDFLAHHGILGMKWGVRRYQDKSGRLTAAGKKRYSQSEMDSIKKTTKIATTLGGPLAGVIAGSIKAGKLGTREGTSEKQPAPYSKYSKKEVLSSKKYGDVTVFTDDSPDAQRTYETLKKSFGELDAIAEKQARQRASEAFGDDPRLKLKLETVLVSPARFGGELAQIGELCYGAADDYSAQKTYGHSFDVEMDFKNKKVSQVSMNG